MRSNSFFYALEAMHSIFCALDNAFGARKKIEHIRLARSFFLPLSFHACSDVERFMQQLVACAHDNARGEKREIVLPVGGSQLSISSRALVQYGDAFSLNLLFAAMHLQGHAMHARIACMQLDALWQQRVSMQDVSSSVKQSLEAADRWIALQFSYVIQDLMVDNLLKATRFVHDTLPLLITAIYIYHFMPLADDAFAMYWLAWRLVRYPFMQNAYSVACATLWSSMHILFFLSQARWSLDHQTLLFGANVVTVSFAAWRFYHYRQGVTHYFDAIHDPRAALVFAAYVIIASCSLQLGDNAYAHTKPLQASYGLAWCVPAALYTFVWYVALVAWKEWVADNPRLQDFIKKHSIANDRDSLVCMTYQAVQLLKELSFSTRGIPQLMPAKQPFVLQLNVKNTRAVISPSITGVYGAAFGHVVICSRIKRWLQLSEEALTSACSSAYLQGTNQANDDVTGAVYRKELSGFLQVLHASHVVSVHVMFSQGLLDISQYLSMIHTYIHADHNACSWVQALYEPNASDSKQQMARELELFLALYVLKISVGTDAERICTQLQWTADFFWGKVFVTAAALRIALELGFCPQRKNDLAFSEIVDTVSWLCDPQDPPLCHALARSIDVSELFERLLNLRHSYGPCVRAWGVNDARYSDAQLSKDVDAMVQSLAKIYAVFSIAQPILDGKQAVVIPNHSWSAFWQLRLSIMGRFRQLWLCCFPQSTWTGGRLEVSWQGLLLKKQYVASVWLYMVTCLRARWMYGYVLKELQLIYMHAVIARQSFFRCGVAHTKSIIASLVRCLGLLPALLLSVTVDASLWVGLASALVCYDGLVRVTGYMRACAVSAMRIVVSNPLTALYISTLGFCVGAVATMAQPFVMYALGVVLMVGAVGLLASVLGGAGDGGEGPTSRMSSIRKPPVSVVGQGTSAVVGQASSSQLRAGAVPVVVAPPYVSQCNVPQMNQGTVSVIAATC